jgi:DNA-binding MarR family transcriptional regulator
MKAARLERRLSAHYDAALSAVGLTVRQFSLLGHVAFAPGLAVQVLAQRVGIDATTLTRNLKPLVAAGWLTLTMDPDDRRLRRIELTAEGEAKLRDGLPHWRRAQTAITEALGARGSELANVLDKTAQRLKSLSG